VIGGFANPFAVGPELTILLILCGALASRPPGVATATAAPTAAEAGVSQPGGARLGYSSATGSPRMLKPPST